MKKQVKWFLFYGIMSGLAAFNLSACTSPDMTHQNYSQQFQTVSAMLAQTMQVHTETVPVPSTPARPFLTATQSPTSVTHSPTLTVIASGTLPAVAILPLTPTVACDLAQPGHPIDVTVPDGTSFHPGEAFSKTWRLVNAGSCAWDDDYKVIWFSGDNLGLVRSSPLNQPVEPGESVEITVDMLAPQEPGTYQSNWKLSNSRGQLFGIGPDGNAPFWVRIIVLPIDTATALPPEEAPQLPATPTATSEALFRSRSLSPLALTDPLSPGGGLLSPVDGEYPALMAINIETVVGPAYPGAFSGWLP